MSCPQCKQELSIESPGKQANAKNRYSISDFLSRTGRKDRRSGLFELASHRLGAFEGSPERAIKMIGKATGMLDGRLSTVKLRGDGVVAITSHHHRLTLAIAPNKPIITDRNATVASPRSLAHELKTHTCFTISLGRSSGEPRQSKFQANGFVVIEPSEETHSQAV